MFLISITMFVCTYVDILLELSGREEEARIIPDPDIDTYMKVHRVIYSVLFPQSFTIDERKFY